MAFHIVSLHVNCVKSPDVASILSNHKYSCINIVVNAALARFTEHSMGQRTSGGHLSNQQH